MLNTHLLVMVIFSLTFMVVRGSRLFVTQDEFQELKAVMMKFKTDQEGKIEALANQFKTLEQLLRDEIEKGRLKNKQLEMTIEKTELQNAELKAKLEETEMRLDELQKHVTKNTIDTKGRPQSSKVFQNNDTKQVPYMIQKYNDFSKENSPRIRRSQFKIPRMLVGSATPKVAFFANGLADGNKLTVNQILKYTKVGVNTGNCYHASTGVFTCTVAGTYAFFYNQICNSGVYVQTALVKDGVPINYCACDGRPSHYSSCGITTIVHYNVGDSIWVRVQASTSQNAFAGEDSFSGFLLYQD